MEALALDCCVGGKQDVLWVSTLSSVLFFLGCVDDRFNIVHSTFGAYQSFNTIWDIPPLLTCGKPCDMRASHVYRDMGATMWLSLWTHKLFTYLHPWESHNLCSFTSAVSCKKAISLGKARSLAGVEGQSFTWTGTPISAAALTAWSAKALQHSSEIGSLDLVWATHLTTATDEDSWHTSNNSPISLPCLTGVSEDAMNPQFAHSVPKSYKHPKAYLESVYMVTVLPFVR